MKMLTASDVAKLVSCSETTVRNFAAKGKLPFRCIKLGAMWRFPEDEVMAYILGPNYAKTEAKVEDSGSTESRAE